MKKKNTTVPAPSKLNLLRQICNFIPEFLVPKLARETGVQAKCRTFSAWSHVVSLLFAQLAHSIGLNDVCDALGLHSGPLSSLRGATVPSRNNFSHANKVRPAVMAEKLFWAVFEPWGNVSPQFVSGKAGKRFARRFKRTIPPSCAAMSHSVQQNRPDPLEASTKFRREAKTVGGDIRHSGRFDCDFEWAIEIDKPLTVALPPM